MAPSLFAGICVSDYAEGRKWYERFFGSEPAFEPHDTECVWDIAGDRSIFILEDPDRAGHATHTILVEDVGETVSGIAERGIEPAESETYSNGVTKVIFRDPDGNEIGYSAAPEE
jgi:catechol 2,3-dioxygenase-like lactoylglutathione lyase family enzyme